MNRTKQLTAALNTFYEKPIAKVSLELFFSIGLVLFLAYFAIQPTLVTMSNLIKEIEDKQKLDDDLGKKLASLASAQTEYATVQSQLYVLDQAIPRQPDIVGNLKTIEKLAADSNIIIQSLAAVEMPEDTPVDADFSDLERKTLPVRLNVTGDYMAIRTFVEKLINNRRVYVTDSINLSVSDRTLNKTLQASINITIPYYGLKETGTNASN